MAKSKKQHEREEGLTKLLRRQAQRFLDKPGITSVGVGYRVTDGKESDELCIQFTVEKKVALESLETEGLEPLPTSFTDEDGNEVPVDVLQRSYTPSLRVIEPEPTRPTAADAAPRGTPFSRASVSPTAR